MTIKTTLKASVAAAALLAVSAPVVSSTADAGSISNGKDIAITMSGQIARSVVMVDNGGASETQHIDGGNDTNSRLRILGSAPVTESVTVGLVWEANLPTANRGVGTIAKGGTNGLGGQPGTFGHRKTDMSFTHASLGKFSIGQGDTASDNKPSLDSTGTNNAGLTYAGNTVLFDTVANANTTLTAGGEFSSQFGGRKSRIRYDLPSVAGFDLGFDLADDNYWDVGLKYGATYGDVQVAAAIQYQALNASSADNSSYGAGIALKHSSGLSAGVHYGEKDTDTVNRDPKQFGVEVGYTTKSMSNLGASSINFSYVKADEAATDEMEAKKWGIALNQDLPSSVKIFASYEKAEFDDGSATTNYDDVSTALLGTYIAF